MILRRYTLSINGPENVPAEEGSADEWFKSDDRVLADLPAMLEEAEENLSDLLPEGYSATIEVKE
jgi:hypothetical protein